MSVRKSRISPFDMNSHFQTVTSPSGLGHGVHASSEKESNLMYSQLKHLYEARLETLAQGIRDAFRLVQSDELIDTMRQDMTSEEYVNQRVREIIEECINSNREALMEQLSQQIVDLHLEYGRLENENVKLLTQQEALVIEANQKIEEADEQTRLYQEEAANVKAAFRDLEGKFEESLKKKDETLIERAEKDAAEINLTKDRVKDLENKLKEAEKKHWELAKREVTLQKEQEVQRGKIKQLEADINNLNLELKASNTREEASQKKIGEYKEIQKDLERKIEEHKRENNGLKSDIELSEINKKNMEEMFNLKIQQIENAIKQEQDDHKINIEKLQNKYKEKMEKYKKKILEGKSQLALREKEANEIRKRNEESRFQTDRNAEGMQVRLQEQQEYYENQIVHIEEENHRKMNELQIKYDDQLRELQSHFQRVLEQKIEQIQEDSQEQIGQIREQEKELQELLEEKIIQIEREYIKISQHEEILLEKDKLVERFKQEIGNAEAHHRQELGLKLKGLEGRMRDEIEEKERTFKGVVRDLETKISSLEAEKRKLTEDLGEKIEETKILSRHIEELEAQKNRLFSTIEEWGVKSKKLKEALEEEQRKRVGLENNVREQHENFGEIRMLLDDTKKEIKDRDNHINELEQQVELLESSLSDEARRYRELEIEYEESRKEGLKREQGQERVIAEIRKERETLEEDKRKLIEKIRDIERSSHDTFENEVQTHEDTKARLKQAETRAKIMISDLKAMEDEIKKLNGYIEELEKENLKTRSTIEDFENAFKETEREKIELEQGLENSRLLHEEFKREMEAVLIDKLRALRIEFREVETDCLNAINTVKRDIQFEIETMVPRFRKILEKKDEQFKFEKEAFRERLEADFGNELQGIREEYDKVLKEYNLQLAEKERTIDLMDQKQGIMTEITETLEVDAQKERQKIIDLEEESEMDKIEITELKKEKSHLEQRIEEMRARFIDELNDMRRASEEFALGKRELEQKYESDVGELTRQNYMLKEKFNQKMAIYEVKVKDLNSKQALEISGVQKDYEDQLESITEELARVQEMENLLRKENSKLRDEIERLHQEGEDTERQRQETMTVYETKLQELERDLDETSNVTKRESQLAEGLVFEKTNEIKRYKKTIQDLEEELKLRGQRIENLLQEKGRSVQVINELQEQLGVKQAELERQKEDMAYKSTYHSKEIDQLQKLLTKSYQTANEAPERRRKKENESDFQKSVEQLRNLDKYLEHKSPQRSYFMSTSREREVDFTSSRSRTDVAELRSSRERKYPSKYEKW